MPLIYDIEGPPIEIAEGRGDLRYSSVPVGGEGGLYARSISLVGERNISFAVLFATQPWVAAAVMRMLTWAIRVPLKVYRRTGDDSRVRLRPDEHPLAAALAQPWSGGVQAQLIMALLGPLLVHGNSVTEIQQGAGDKIQFNALDWRSTTPLILGNELRGFQYTDGITDPRPIGLDTGMHIAWWSPLGPIGVSPLYQLGITLAIENAAQRYQRSIFQNGARPPSAITATEGFLGLAQEERTTILKNLREDVNALYSGPENGGRPSLLPPGLDWKPVGHSAVEAELIDQRKVAREEVAGVYLIPPPMMGILDKATYSNIQTQREMAYTDSLGPPLVLIEQILNGTVVTGLLREDDIFSEFDFAGVLRGDRLKEIQALRQAISSGLLTPNEGRSILNAPQSTDELADKLWMPRNNLRPIDEPPYLPRGGEVEPDDDPTQSPKPSDEPPADIDDDDN